MFYLLFLFLALIPHSEEAKIAQQNKSLTLPIFSNAMNMTSIDWDAMHAFVQARASYVDQVMRSVNKNPSNGDVVALSTVVMPAVSVRVLYTTKLTIGSPAATTTLGLDTGSSLTWTQCAPCQSCFTQPDPIMDPEASSTYEELTCDDRLCPANRWTSFHCRDDVCTYEVSYAMGTRSEGELGSDDFTLGGVAVHDVVFGCSHKSDFHVLEKLSTNGLMGLNGGDLSFVSQLNFTKFSFCLHDIYDFKHQSAFVFGDDAMLRGPSTPLIIQRQFGGWYFVNLDDITVGFDRLNLRPGLLHLNTSTGRGGLILDTGSTMSLFQEQAFDALAKKVAEVALLPVDHNDDSKLCFFGDRYDVLKTTFPFITFHFKGDLDLVTYPKHFFYTTRNRWSQIVTCLAVKRGSTSEGKSIFGAMMMQDVYVGKDLQAMKVYMSRASAGCSIF